MHDCLGLQSVISYWQHKERSFNDIFLAFLGKIKIELLKGMFLVGLHQGVGGSPLWLLKY